MKSKDTTAGKFAYGFKISEVERMVHGHPLQNSPSDFIIKVPAKVRDDGVPYDSPEEAAIGAVQYAIDCMKE